MITNKTRINPGDVISNRSGLAFTVSSVLFQDHYGDRFGYDVEFIYDQNAYHHWKQDEDGGTVTRSVPHYHD